MGTSAADRMARSVASRTSAAAGNAAGSTTSRLALHSAAAAASAAGSRAVTARRLAERLASTVATAGLPASFVTTRTLPATGVGDLLVIEIAGAYGFVMASNYNSKPLPAEVLVDGGSARLVRARQAVEDLVRGEIVG